MSLNKLLAKKLRIEEQEQLVLRSLAEILTTCKPLEVILFGSAARQEMTEASDLDFVVIVENQDEVKPVQRLLNRVAARIDWPIDCLVIDFEQFQQRAAAGGVYFLAKSEGKVLYQKSV